MDKLYYLGIVERGEDGYYVSFPDLPGCVSAGDSLQQAAANAEDALALHLAGMAEDGEAPPAPSAPDTVAADPDLEEVARLMIGAASGKALRVNVSLDVALLAAIDAVGGNRSSFLAQAAWEKLRREHV